MIKQLLSGLIAGLLLTIFLAQHDEWVRQRIGNMFIAALNESLHCSMQARVDQVNFFSGELELSHVIVRPQDPADASWQWTCSKYRTYFSWFDLLFYGTIDFAIEVKNLAIESRVINERIAIESHINMLLTPPDLPIYCVLKSLTLDSSYVHIGGENQPYDVTLFFKSFSKKINDRFKSTIYIKQGYGNFEGTAIAKDIQGIVYFDGFETLMGPQIACTLDCRSTIVSWDESEECFISGSWDRDHGRFMIYNADHTLQIDPIIVTQKNNVFHMQSQGRMPIAYALALSDKRLKAVPVTGTCIAQLRGTYDKHFSCNAQLLLEDIRHTALDEPINARVLCQKRNNKWRGTLGLSLHKRGDFCGEWHWNQRDQSAGMQIINTTPVKLSQFPFWNINQRECTISGTFDKGAFHISYDYGLTHTLSNTLHTGRGTIAGSIDALAVEGAINNQLYKANVSLTEYPYIKNLTYKAHDGELLLQLQHEKDNPSLFTAFIYIPFIRSLTHTTYNFDLQGDGILELKGRLNNNILEGSVSLSNGAIRIPQTYNFMDGLDAHFSIDFFKRSFSLDQVDSSLHTGAIKSEHAVCVLAPDYSVEWLHIPLTLDQCLINIQQDLFAMVSGALTLQKARDKKAKVSGSLIIDRGQLKENLFSTTLQKRLFSQQNTQPKTPWYDVECAISVQTKDLLRIDTAFLQANAAVHLSLTNNFLNPDITGNIAVSSGRLFFPYKALNIVSGSLTFAPGLGYDPEIEVIAKNKIKKYSVTLQANGSLSYPQLMLDSSPPLSQEQIVSLLFVGSEEQMLNAMMPALIVQNIKNILFGAHHTSLLERYLRPLGKPFSINLVPSFIDQTGRGGLRGAIEIEVNDRWRALIQKNFSLTEDTRFEVEYLLSDDISIRGIRDERSDFGAEVEMKWKF